MYKNAIEQINKFYEINLNNNANKIFDILNSIIQFETCGILYICPNNLSFEMGNLNIPKNIPIDENFSNKIYENSTNNYTKELKKILNLKSNILVKKLTTKGTMFGLLVIVREKEFSKEEAIIFKTCASIISNLIKDLELSKVLKMQVEALQKGIIETNKAYETIKKQNKKIKENEKLQNEFVANISHDLRTPLNSVIGFSEVLSSKIFGDLTPKQSEYIEDIRLSGIRLLGMINEILDISKISSHTIKLNLSDVDLNLAIDEVCNILAPAINKKQIQIIKETQNNRLKADYIKIQQILFNLLGNAIKFSNPQSKIEITTQTNKNNTVIKIKDHGIGIDKKYQKRIFDKFYQVENALSKTETSTGLGLTITKEFVSLHHGKIELESEPNKGTTFTISIPTNYFHG